MNESGLSLQLAAAADPPKSSWENEATKEFSPAIRFEHLFPLESFPEPSLLGSVPVACFCELQ